MLFKGCRSPTVAAMICSSVSGVFALGESADLSSSIYTLFEPPQIGTHIAISEMSSPTLESPMVAVPSNAALQPSRHLPQKFVNTTGLAEALKFNKHTTLAASAASAG